MFASSSSSTTKHMRTFEESLFSSFHAILRAGETGVAIPPSMFKEDTLKYAKMPDEFSFMFGESNEFELTFERLLFDDQWYVALYKDREPLIEKIVVRPGHSKVEEEPV